MWGMKESQLTVSYAVEGSCRNEITDSRRRNSRHGIYATRMASPRILIMVPNDRCCSKKSFMEVWLTRAIGNVVAKHAAILQRRVSGKDGKEKNHAERCIPPNIHPDSRPVVCSASEVSMKA